MSSDRIYGDTFNQHLDNKDVQKLEAKVKELEGCDANYQRQRHRELKKKYAKLEKELAEIKEATRWRDIAVELPKDDKDVLVIYPTGIGLSVARFDHGLNSWDDCWTPVMWRPIEIPKAKQEGAE